MNYTIKSIGNLAAGIIALLGLIALFFDKLEPIYILIILVVLFFMGVMSIIVYKMNNLENEIKSLEEKYKRAEELMDIRAEIIALKRNKK
jgi:membrane protein insertase Oxa1/YidC/SpoIIIJ